MPPEATAVAVVERPVVWAIVALLVSLESQMKQTFSTSISGPPVLLKARAKNACVAPILIEADAGVTSTRVIVGEPKGVPSARVPGENVRPAAFVAEV